MPNSSILVINSGSSSLKFGLFRQASRPSALKRGSVDTHGREQPLAELQAEIAHEVAEHPLSGIGHRVVHGGSKYAEPVLVSDRVLEDLAGIVPFAPNHLPGSISLIEQARRVWPTLPHVLCFDTAFHARLPDTARRLPIPRAFAERGLHRYGFHGLSYAFLMQELRRLVGDAADGRIVLAHLGNGSSLAAVLKGTSIDTSMSFTPLAGVVMSTRPGDLDPGVVTYMLREGGLDAGQLDRVLSHESGLAGISGGITDMRELVARESSDAECRLAVAIYCYEIRKRIGAYAAALGGLDILVFSGGIGEHAALVRSRICEDLGFLGVRLDEARNAANAAVIADEQARVSVRVIPTDEEIVIAQSVYELLHLDQRPGQ